MKKRQENTFFKYFYILWSTALLLSNLGCLGKSGNKVDDLFGLDPEIIEVPVPTELKVDITLPSADGEPAGFQVTVSGTCSPAGKSIEISGDAVGVAVCGLDSTWSATVDTSAASVGSISITATMVEDENQSAPSSRQFTKFSSACDLQVDRDRRFANYGTTGDGGATPWIICTPLQLSNVNLNQNDNFELHNEVNFNNGLFNPIGNFRGTFEGNNFTISNYVINTSANERALIRYAWGASFRNLIIRNAQVTGNYRVGALVGWWRESCTASVVDNVHVYDSNFTTLNEAGGLIGRVGRDNNATACRETIFTIQNSSVNNTELDGNATVGGLIGYVINTQGSFTATNISANNVDVAGGGSSIGGVIGNINEPNSTISNISSSGSVTGSYDYVGGVFGIARGTLSNITSSITVSNNSTNRSYTGGLFGWFGGTLTAPCTSSGNILASETNRVGGLIGHVTNTGVTIDGCSATGNVSGQSYVGGLIGYADSNSTVQNIDMSGLTDRTVTGTGNETGGVIGRAYTSTNIINVAASHNVTGVSSVGGVVGYARGGTSGTFATYNQLNATGNVTATGNNVGGAIGYSYRYLTISNSAVSGDISSPTGQNVGGFLGYNDQYSTISSSNATGNVSGAIRVGGFVGRNGYRHIITYSYARGDVTGGGDYVGGFSGYSRTAEGTRGIYDSFATGNVSGGVNYVGGFDGGSNESNRSLVRTYAIGSVSATGRYVGGHTGYIRAGTDQFTDNFSTGQVSGNQDVGGLVGYFRRNSTNAMRRSYTVGQVIKINGATGGDATFGAVLGTRNGNINLLESNSVFYNLASPVLDEAASLPLAGANSYGSGRTQLQLQTQADFQNAPANYDFTTPIWELPSATYMLPGTSIIYTYPIHEWAE